MMIEIIIRIRGRNIRSAIDPQQAILLYKKIKIYHIEKDFFHQNEQITLVITSMTFLHFTRYLN